jgi:hypothetical protein
MERSKYIQYKRTKSPRNPRAKRVDGCFEDRGRFYHCWRCGFIFDVETTSMGAGSASPAGDPTGNLNIDDRIALYGIVRLDSAGDPVVPVVMPSHTVSSGCPLCGMQAQFGNR